MLTPDLNVSMALGAQLTHVVRLLILLILNLAVLAKRDLLEMELVAQVS